MKCEKEFVALMSRLHQDRHFTLCPKCTFEIDLRVDRHVFVDDFYVHEECPVITPKYT